MRFLVDAQLPPALARWLVSQAHEAVHVVDCGLERADDRAIWNHASSSGAIILTKDEDFASRRTLAQHGPCVVWIRLGNTSRCETLRWFASVFPDVLEALARGDTLIEIT
jgi:predicted nuclease of predicted toxin-antitoxin system